MNTNKTNQGMNIEDYEDMAVQKSNVAKRLAVGAGVVVGGAAVTGGAAYAATSAGSANNNDDSQTGDDKAGGAQADGGVHAEAAQPSAQPSAQPAAADDHVVVEHHYVDEKPEPAHEPTHESAHESDDDISWDKTTNIYDENGQKVGTLESGTYQGKNISIVDTNGDGHADMMAYDVNGNGKFDDNEFQELSYEDHIHMGHETASTHDVVYDSKTGDFLGEVNSGDHYVAHNDVDAHDSDSDGGDDMIHNDFSDEKTGEEYDGDFADNNPDYNSNGDADNYLADNESYDNEGYDNDNDNDDDYLADASADVEVEETEETDDSGDAFDTGDDFMV